MRDVENSAFSIVKRTNFVELPDPISTYFLGFFKLSIPASAAASRSLSE
jgi:hypothetical protein